MILVKKSSVYFSDATCLDRDCFCENNNSMNSNNQKQPPEVFYKKGILKNFAKFTGKHLCQSLFFNKVAGPRTEHLQNTSGRLLLNKSSKNDVGANILSFFHSYLVSICFKVILEI